MKLIVATCQFPVSGELPANMAWMERQMQKGRTSRTFPGMLSLRIRGHRIQIVPAISINDRGALVVRYDKMFCTGDAHESNGDLKHYMSGNRFVTFQIRGIKCGLQICHDFRYQELYREYKKRNVQFVFHSYHNGKASRAEECLENHRSRRHADLRGQ